ncbi:MAG: hypothetical protein AB2L11_04255 [Syntrophobacteraceae bacterium]
MKTLRWITAFPAAFAGAYPAYFVGGFINNLLIALFLGVPPEGLPRIASEVMANMYLGAAFIYSAVRIAPSAPRVVAVAGVVLLMLFSGLSVWLSYGISEFYGIPANGGILFGGVAALFGTFAGKIAPYGGGRPKRRKHTR